MKPLTLVLIIIGLIILSAIIIKVVKSANQDAQNIEKFLEKLEKEQPKSIEDALAKKEIIRGMTKQQVESMYGAGEVFDRRYWDDKIALNDPKKIEKQKIWARVKTLNKGDLWYAKYHYPKYDYLVYYNKNEVVIDLVAKPAMPDDRALPPE